MNVILVLGAGRSSTTAISYLLKEAEKNGWQILVGDSSLAAAQARIKDSTHGNAFTFDIHKHNLSRSILAQADIVVSLLPPHLHLIVAEVCLEMKKHLLTASYVSEEMLALNDEAKSRNLLFLNECGLDPGIDHMSAMQVIDRIKERGGKLISFKSFTGGLISPETDPENPWRYKFTWNPRNVVLAGQSTAKFLQGGQYKYIPYQQLFKRTTPVRVDGYGEYEGYANRDSLKYIDAYGLEGIQTMLRGTLRSKGFCDAWSVLVQLGCCDNTYFMEGVNNMTHRNFINAFLAYDSEKSVEEKLSFQFQLDLGGLELQKLEWSGFFDDVMIGLDRGTPAQILEHILSKKWKLGNHDKDLIVMHHGFVFEIDGKVNEINSSLVVRGDDAINTAMAKTVGLPLGIAAKLLLQGKIKKRGVAIPIDKEIYNPVLAELKQLGIELREKEVSL